VLYFEFDSISDNLIACTVSLIFIDWLLLKAYTFTSNTVTLEARSKRISCDYEL
jgi:hypothetical protein